MSNQPNDPTEEYCKFEIPKRVWKVLNLSREEQQNFYDYDHDDQNHDPLADQTSESSSESDDQDDERDKKPIIKLMKKCLLAKACIVFDNRDVYDFYKLYSKIVSLPNDNSDYTFRFTFKKLFGSSSFEDELYNLILKRKRIKMIIQRMQQLDTGRLFSKMRKIKKQLSKIDRAEITSDNLTK